MPTLNLKWTNFNLAIRIKVNNGAVYVIAMAAAFLYAVLSNWIKPMAENFLAGEGAIWAISATMLKFQKDNNKLDVEAAKANAGPALDAIKAAAAGISPTASCPEGEQK
jgi:hypothetical protein